jgi:hypothetical protein
MYDMVRRVADDTCTSPQTDGDSAGHADGLHGGNSSVGMATSVDHSVAHLLDRDAAVLSNMMSNDMKSNRAAVVSEAEKKSNSSGTLHTADGSIGEDLIYHWRADMMMDMPEMLLANLRYVCV